MDHIKSLLVYLMKNSPKILGRTELMKYVYLFEYFYFQLYGKRYSNIEFTRYHYGPNDRSVIKATDQLKNDGIIKIEEYPNYYGTTSYDHIFLKESQHNKYDFLPEDAVLVAEFIIDKFEEVNVDGVKKYSYDTPPMKSVLEEERSVGRTLLGRVLDMSKTGPVYKSTRQRKEEARKRLQQRDIVRGSDQDYYEELLRKYECFEDTVRRANLVESKLSR